MADLVNLTIDGKAVQAAPGTLLINAAKNVGIEIPSFCYYDGLTLQAACRMCLVEVEKTPKLQVACTTPVAEGMVVHTDTPVVHEARKSMVELLLTNHPLDCPVCDKGGECELQDMTFRYGIGESRFVEEKVHTDEAQWSPVVFYDAPRCILCYRCVRVCNEGMGVNALGVSNRGVISEIVPNEGDHLACDECGMCIDICPVGALTSGMYRYKTRPWEMEHVGTICTHCADGCKTTLGVRAGEIMRGNNRDHSGINGEFLCMKGRYAFDFVHNPERLQAPLVRRNGKLEPVSWGEALSVVAKKFAEVKQRGGKFGVIGSNHTTNEENYTLRKFAREVLGTSNIDHHRTGDVATLLDALSGRTDVLATTSDLYERKSILIVASDLAQQHPFLAYQVRANFRHHNAHVYSVTPGPIRENAYTVAAVTATAGQEIAALEGLREKLKAEPELVILFGDSIRGEAVRQLVSFGDSLGIPVKYIPLVDYSNSRGAYDMGLMPGEGAPALDEMLADASLDALWVVGANPLKRAQLAAAKAFVVVQDLFLTETASHADVVFPAASAYEKNGTVTNTCGEVQKLKPAVKVMGTKTDLEIIGLLAKEMGANIGVWLPDNVFAEIRANVRGYNIPLPIIATGGAAQTAAVNGRVPATLRPELIRSAGDTLYTSGSLGRYSKTLNTVLEAPGALYQGK
ncbi:MAG TPA: NADH-quinone oxidoreductase subunit NuoG [Bryobacteraceae bacterium]|nr:NADH-quinone oxidoreductase subunit NuoG [Bryobacteraceae bacterium]